MNWSMQRDYKDGASVDSQNWEMKLALYLVRLSNRYFMSTIMYIEQLKLICHYHCIWRVESKRGLCAVE